MSTIRIAKRLQNTIHNNRVRKTILRASRLYRSQDNQQEADSFFERKIIYRLEHFCTVNLLLI